MIQIALVLLAQWKGFDPLTHSCVKPGQPEVNRASTDLPPGVEPSIGYGISEPKRVRATSVDQLAKNGTSSSKTAFVPSKLPVDQESTSKLRIRLVTCQERCQQLTLAINRNAGQFYASAGGAGRRDNCSPSRQQMIQPRVQPESQSARYLAHNHKLQFQLRAVQTEIAQIEQELLRRGENA